MLSLVRLSVALLFAVPLSGAAAQHPAVSGGATEPATVNAVAAYAGAVSAAAVNGARSQPAPARGWLWPLEPRPAVVRAFDPPARPWLSGHRGVDLAAQPGQGLLAPDDGVIAFAGWVVDRPVLTIDHGDGLRSSFEPVETDLDAGSLVTPGQPIGRIAAAPLHCEGACLHWGVRKDDDYVSPLRFLVDTRPSILLPWQDP
ncbi:M23 family metallopeptidase [Sinomonas humi]|uniref:M23ase beta-sheet core domain-containing protein n=1 Tax=Sinomonas humi TaxID=1338436 RepID=A0A0B2AH52_9MICC|nr:M23 family metallopeptidase [Sinomonas humi]KHL01147.1 hypothetical protein LK10_17030 [Sinomonas humi]